MFLLKCLDRGRIAMPKGKYRWQLTIAYYMQSGTAETTTFLLGAMLDNRETPVSGSLNSDVASEECLLFNEESNWFSLFLLN